MGRVSRKISPWMRSCSAAQRDFFKATTVFSPITDFLSTLSAWNLSHPKNNLPEPHAVLYNASPWHWTHHETNNQTAAVWPKTQFEISSSSFESQLLSPPYVNELDAVTHKKSKVEFWRVMLLMVLLQTKPSCVFKISAFPIFISQANAILLAKPM